MVDRTIQLHSLPSVYPEGKIAHYPFIASELVQRARGGIRRVEIYVFATFADLELFIGAILEWPGTWARSWNAAASAQYLEEDRW